MVIQVRRRLLDAAYAFRDNGITAPGVDNSEHYRVRSASVILDCQTDWRKATEDVLKAYTPLPVANA